MALAPWPNAGTQSLTKAIATLRSAARIGDDETAARLGAVAAAMVEDYAPGAPQSRWYGFGYIFNCGN